MTWLPYFSVFQFHQKPRYNFRAHNLEEPFIVTTSKNTPWKTAAAAYDLGRPLPETQVAALFQPLLESNFQPKIVFEPGAGTGRILLPLASRWPTATLYAVDSSRAMLASLREKAAESALANICAVEADLLTYRIPEPAELTVLSSVLHLLANWERALDAVIENAAQGGTIALVGEEGDLYNLVLGRSASFTENHQAPLELVNFWTEYLRLRQHSGAESPEASQVGIRWDASNDALSSALARRGMKEFCAHSVIWHTRWSSESLLQIIKEKSYSSITTLREDQHRAILEGMRKYLDNSGFSFTFSTQQATLRCFKRGRYP